MENDTGDKEANISELARILKSTNARGLLVFQVAK